MRGLFKRKGSDIWQGRFHVTDVLPFDAPPSPTIPKPPEADNAAWRAAVVRMAAEEQEALKADLPEYLKRK